jgi:hypothetical protein
LLRQFGAFLNAKTVVHFVLRSMACCGNELPVVLLDGINGVG